MTVDPRTIPAAQRVYEVFAGGRAIDWAAVAASNSDEGILHSGDWEWALKLATAALAASPVITDEIVGRAAAELERQWVMNASHDSDTWRRVAASVLKTGFAA